MTINKIKAPETNMIQISERNIQFFISEKNSLIKPENLPIYHIMDGYRRFVIPFLDKITKNEDPALPFFKEEIHKHMMSMKKLMESEDAKGKRYLEYKTSKKVADGYLKIVSAIEKYADEYYPEKPKAKQAIAEKVQEDEINKSEASQESIKQQNNRQNADFKIKNETWDIIFKAATMDRVFFNKNRQNEKWKPNELQSESYRIIASIWMDLAHAVIESYEGINERAKIYDAVLDDRKEKHPELAKEFEEEWQKNRKSLAEEEKVIKEK